MKEMRNIVAAINNVDVSLMTRYASDLIAGERDGLDIMTTMMKIQDKTHDKFNLFMDILTYSAENIIHKGQEYSLFCIPVIGNVEGISKHYNPETLIQTLVEYTMDDEYVFVADKLVHPGNVFQERYVFRDIILDNIAKKGKSKECGIFTLPDNLFYESNMVNPETLGLNGLVTYSEENGVNYIGLRFIMGAIIRKSRKNLNVYGDIINRNKESQYYDTGLHGTLLGDLYNRDEMVHEKDMMSCLEDISNLLGNIASVHPPCSPNHPFNAWECVILSEVSLRSQYASSLSKKAQGHFYFNEEEDVLSIAIVIMDGNQVESVLDYFEKDCNKMFAEALTDAVGDSMKVVIHETPEFVKMVESEQKPPH